MDRDQVCNATNTFTHEVEVWLANTAHVQKKWRQIAEDSVRTASTYNRPVWWLFESKLRRELNTWDDQADTLFCGKSRKYADKNIFQASLFVSATAQVDTRWIAECWCEQVITDKEDTHVQ